MNIYELNKGDKVSVYFTFNGGAGSGSSGSAEVEGIVYKVEDNVLKIKRERYGKVERVSINARDIIRLQKFN